MFFTKFPHPSNFSFADRFSNADSTVRLGSLTAEFRVQSFEGDIHKLTLKAEERWPEPRRVMELSAPPLSESKGCKADLSFNLAFSDGVGEYLKSVDGKAFGVSGATWMFCFEVGTEARYFGMGEKFFGKLELSGVRTKFWNTDVWGDFHFGQWHEHASDPPYLSIPYLIIRENGGYTGILVNNGYPAYFETPGLEGERVFVEWQKTSPYLIVGAEGGQPEIWIIRGPDLRSLTRKLQSLVGKTPVPPLWSLGYHQSRWGYAGEKDLFALNKEFAERDIPCAGLWLDIDYMDGYRIFTVEESHFPNGVTSAFDKLKRAGRRVVAIIDPGVKREDGYEVYEDGTQKGVFCQNVEGGQYVGLVWPGETVFPDLTQQKARDWWSERVEKFCKIGFGGFWLDMNDPSTGPVDPTGMLFNDGKEPHAAQRNDYALAMQKATFEGMRKATPDERPFLLSRSGSQGTSRYSAVWTGDNVSNYAYLRLSIPTSLGLSISGVPFNGPDIGGFGGDVSERLMIDWMKACFLFPFTRNHTGFGTRHQEPWAFSPEAEDILTKYIRLRYKLMPYIYNLFCDQEELGDPILRPLFYEFKGDFDRITDQFLVGPNILQAPIVKKAAKARRMTLPGVEPWFDGTTGDWVKSGNTNRKPTVGETPLFIRNGSIVPMQGEGGDDLRNVEFHIFAAPGTSGSTKVLYKADDGLSYGYQRGERTTLELSVEWTSTDLKVRTSRLFEGFGPINATFIVHAGERHFTLDGETCATKIVELSLSGITFEASRLEVKENAKTEVHADLVAAR